ncbi:hypothetical protein A3SI_17187 [Nitritalea halalkaliphila LW7]|uniref:Lipoprotein n=1 Tax=Nitritalea halalkaliphila LW7 TaxID=1189621 RepID=I5BW52_9BACT|nr:hypothetical protein [Nitritalea halalkaliphila]EIM73804.1 hypothetical protein A3SI_17187 [Nitritalea halalkaliphila LW7]
MKKILKNTVLALSLASLSLVACDIDPTQPLRDIIREDLGYLPVVAGWSLRTPAAAELRPGANATLDLRFWSEGEIDRIRLFVTVNGSETMVEEKAYSPAYSEITRTDSLLFSYTVPQTAAVGSPIIFRSEVINRDLPDFPVGRSLTFTLQE